MRIFVGILFVSLFVSCSKNVEVKLPEYKSEIAVEMYLENMRTLRCLVTETVPYTSDTITEMVSNAKVIFSDGIETDTLEPAEVYEYETGRHYNYSSQKIFWGDSTKTYTLKITDSLNRQITASTQFPGTAVKIDSLIYSASKNTKDKFSISLSFTDPANISNYYRFIIGKGINNYTASNTDVLLSDDAFDGKVYGFTSEPGYEKGDTVTVRLYTLLKNHYDYLQSVESAKIATYNPFVQPVRAISNIKGGQGIFTAIRYDEKQLVIR